MELTQRKKLLQEKGYAYLEDATCSFKRENIFGFEYCENLSGELLQAVGLLTSVHPDSIAPNLVLIHIVQAIDEGLSQQSVTINMLNQVLGTKDLLNKDKLSENQDIIKITLKELDT